MNKKQTTNKTKLRNLEVKFQKKQIKKMRNIKEIKWQNIMER